MSDQEVRVGVKADVASAEQAVGKIDKANERLAGSLDQVAGSADAAEQAMAGLEARMERVRKAQEILTREFGRPISQPDAEQFLGNFDRMRNGRSIGGRRLRAFNDLDDWYHGHGTTFPNQRAASQHRRFVMGVGMQGTADSHMNGAPPAGGGGGGGGGGGNEPPEAPTFNRGIQKAQSMAMGFTKGMLALAGINSIMGMAGQAVDMATEESVSTADLKRKIGDLGVEFDALRDQARGATQGLGMTYVESQRLASQYAKVVGNLTSKDLRDRGLQENLRTSFGFSRAYGLDPEQGTQFMGTMKRLGVVGPDDPSGRRLAVMIAEAVEKGGFGGKADEVIGAIADYATASARMLYARPNAVGYAGAMAGLTSMGYAGLDPAGAAALLGRADSTMRRGGGVGEASMNFNFMALRRYSPGIDPVSAQGLMSGGLFGTTEGVFGEGSAMGDWYRSKGLKTPGLNGTTNFDKVRGLMRRTYGNTPYYLNALQRHFGLESPGQAAAMDMMNPKDLTESMRLLKGAGIDMSRVNASGIGMIGKIAATNSAGGLGDIYNSVMGRKDVSESEKAQLAAAFGKASKEGNIQAMKEALVAVVGTKEMVQTEGDTTRRTISELKNELTKVGGLLLGALNPIRDAVIIMARAIAPEAYARDEQNKRNQSATDWDAKYRAMPSETPGQRGIILDQQYKADEIAFARAKKAAKGGLVNIDDIVAPPKPGTSPALEAFDNARRARLMTMNGTPNNRGASFVKPYSGKRIAEIRAAVLAPSPYDAMFQAAAKRYGIDDWRALKMKAVIESGLNPKAIGPVGPGGQAAGMMGLEWRTAAGLGLNRADVLDPAKNIDGGARLYAQLLKRAKGNYYEADKLYYAGSPRGYGPNTMQYADNNAAVRAAIGMNELPPGDRIGKLVGPNKVQVEATLTGGSVMLRDYYTQQRAGTLNLEGSAAPKPAGAPPKKKPK